MCNTWQSLLIVFIQNYVTDRLAGHLAFLSCISQSHVKCHMLNCSFKPSPSCCQILSTLNDKKKKKSLVKGMLGSFTVHPSPPPPPLLTQHSRTVTNHHHTHKLVSTKPSYSWALLSIPSVQNVLSFPPIPRLPQGLHLTSVNTIMTFNINSCYYLLDT